MGELIITPKDKIDEYFDSDALNQSSLKKLTGGIEAYLSQQKEEKTLFYEEKGHFLIGSGVDTMLTGEKGQFEKQYYVSLLDKKPSDTEMSIINMVLEDIVQLYPDTPIDELSKYPGSISKAIIEHDWYGGKPGDTRIKGLIERCHTYFEDLKKGVGKQILTSSEYKMITDIVNSLRSNPRTKKYFDRNGILNQNGITVYYQLPIYFYYKGVYCKAMLDILIIERNSNEEVVGVQAIDLKTMNGSTYRFPNSLRTYRYDIQAAWYKEAIFSKDSSFNLELGARTVEEVFHPFLFIVESNSYPGQPLIFELDEKLMDIGKNGRKPLSVRLPGEQEKYEIKPEIKGFDSLVETYIYQNETDWVEEKVVAITNGYLKIDWEGIIM